MSELSNQGHHWIDRHPIYSIADGKTTIGGGTRCHAPVRGLGILFMRSRAAVSFEVQNINFQDPKRKNDITTGVLSGRSIIWWWNRHHQRAHAPPRAALTSGIHGSRANRPPHLLKPRSEAFQAPIQETGTTFGLLGGRSTICHWNRSHRTRHAPPRAGDAPGASPTREHVSACARHMPMHGRHTPSATCRSTGSPRQP
jgi:hypothetical protein